MADLPPTLDYATPVARKPLGDRLASLAIVILVVLNLILYGFVAVVFVRYFLAPGFLLGL